MSWRSPWTVPMTAVYFGLDAGLGEQRLESAIASFIARAAMNISGTKISFFLNFSPTTAIAGHEPLLDDVQRFHTLVEQRLGEAFGLVAITLFDRGTSSCFNSSLMENLL